MKCFDCGEEAYHNHHVVPRSLGGTATVPLCASCHGKIHGRDMLLGKELCKAALGVKKARGERVGGVPYGFKVAADGVHLVADEAEQAVIARARELRATGMTLRMIVRKLELEGVRARNSKAFAATQINRMVADGKPLGLAQVAKIVRADAQAPPSQSPTAPASPASHGATT